MPKLLSEAVERLMNLPPVQWEEAINAIPVSERQEIERELGGICQRAARLCGYLDVRGATGCGDGGHAAAVRESNRKVAKVRKALGFTQARNDINF